MFFTNKTVFYYKISYPDVNPDRAYFKLIKQKRLDAKNVKMDTM